jgi:hypothetical protein
MAGTPRMVTTSQAIGDPWTNPQHLRRGLRDQRPVQGRRVLHFRTCQLPYRSINVLRQPIMTHTERAAAAAPSVPPPPGPEVVVVAPASPGPALPPCPTPSVLLRFTAEAEVEFGDAGAGDRSRTSCRASKLIVRLSGAGAGGAPTRAVPSRDALRADTQAHMSAFLNRVLDSFPGLISVRLVEAFPSCLANHEPTECSCCTRESLRLATARWPV